MEPKISNVKTYEIHDNGGRPFTVKINQNIVKIYKNIYGTNEAKLEKNPTLTYTAEQIWVGKSPKNEITEFGGYGPNFDGNSILLKLKDQYIYIGLKIYSFLSIAPIKTYISPVGNNDVPYPYCIDVQNNYYLMNENVILLNKKIKEDPYDYYYNHQDISGYKGQPITTTWSYFPDPSGSDYDRLKNRKSMTIVTKDNKKYNLSKQDFINWMKEFGDSMGFKYLDHKILVERQ